MLEVIFLLVLGLIWIVFATIQDIKTREVANWLNFSLIIFALGFRFFWSLFSNDWNFFLYGLIGFGILFVLANLLYYSHFFAGGDAKLLMALGPILPLGTGFFLNLKVLGFFLFILLFAGAVYGLVFSLILMAKNFGKFKKNFLSRIKKQFLLTMIFVIFSLVLFALGFFNWLFFYFTFVVLISYFLFFYAKSLEETCMVKFVRTKDLREGDWLVDDVKKRGKVFVASSWNGLTKREIKILRRNFRNVEIKNGIPFVPAFLIAYVLFWFLFQWFLIWVGSF